MSSLAAGALSSNYALTIAPTSQGAIQDVITLTPIDSVIGALPIQTLTIEADVVACYCRGTHLLSDRGEVRVEHLHIGDILVTAFGDLRPIKWIGIRSYAGRFANANPDVLPVCFTAGSLGEDAPHRDLWVSPKHAMFLDGVLIPAELLVDGVSVVKAKTVERVDYFHIELDNHDVIVAEGALSETFVDDDSRAIFHNARDFAALYPEMQAMPAIYCAPRVEEGPALDAVRRRLAVQAGLGGSATTTGAFRGTLDRADAWGIDGWAQNIGRPEVPVCLDVFVDGVFHCRALAHHYRDDLRVAGVGSGSHSFRLAWDEPLAPDRDHVIDVLCSSDGARLWCSPLRVRATGAAA